MARYAIGKLKFIERKNQKYRLSYTPKTSHCIKSPRIQSFSDRYFPVFGVNAEIYRVNICFQSQCEKIRTRKTLNTNTFRVMSCTEIFPKVPKKKPRGRAIFSIKLQAAGLRYDYFWVFFVVFHLLANFRFQEKTNRSSPL